MVAQGDGAALPDEVGICPGSCLTLPASAGRRAWPAKHRANVEIQLPPDVQEVTNNLELGVSIPAPLRVHRCFSTEAEHTKSKHKVLVYQMHATDGCRTSRKAAKKKLDPQRY